MLTVRLDPETEQQLAEILSHEIAVNRSELVNHLIRERWLALNLDSTFVERRGGHPPNLSCSGTQKALFLNHANGSPF